VHLVRRPPQIHSSAIPAEVDRCTV
jgi:hypothetical protein